MRRIFVQSSLVALGLVTWLQACGDPAGVADATDSGSTDALADGSAVGSDGAVATDGALANDGGLANDGALTEDADAASTDGAVEAGPDAGPDAGPPAVRFVGRFDRSDPNAALFAWPGARIVANFTGTEVKVQLTETPLFTGPSRFDVLLDGQLQPSVLVPNVGTGTYTLATGLAAGAHTIELYRRTEALVGVTAFLGFEFTGGQLLAPPPSPTRRIQFLGDSASNGYGTEGNGPNCAFSGATENEHRAWPGLVAKDLGADHHDLSYSGKGIVQNNDRNDPDVFRTIYTRILPDSPASTWNAANFSPDVVFITLGGNDWDLPAPAPNVNTFTTKYGELVTYVRGQHPNAHIVCAIAPSINDDYPPNFAALTNMRAALTSVVTTRNQAGDAKVYKFEFSRANDQVDLTGCEYHPSPTFHRKLADEAIAFIKTKTGWQ